METINHTVFGKTDTFEIVDAVPTGYMIWNIGANAPEGYLPLCRLAERQPFNGGRNIESDTLKAIKVEGAENILAAIGHGQNTLPEMECYVKIYRNSKSGWVQHLIALYCKAIPIMRKIKDIENLVNL